jgi:hypothetical protein
MGIAYKLAWERDAYKILVGNQKGRGNLGYLDVDWRIIQN